MTNENRQGFAYWHWLHLSAGWSDDRWLTVSFPPGGWLGARWLSAALFAPHWPHGARWRFADATTAVRSAFGPPYPPASSSQSSRMSSRWS